MEKVTITITYDQENGKININGPLDNDVLCYGLIKKAEILVTDWNLKKVRLVDPQDVPQNGKPN